MGSVHSIVGVEKREQMDVSEKILEGPVE